MLVTEPILLLMSLYIALIYGLLYAFFFSFPVVFAEAYGFDDGHAGLTFCSVLIGLAMALFVTPQVEKNYQKRAQAKGGRADPEDRLVGMMIGCWFVPISLFIFGWTSPPVVQPGGGNWVGPVSSGIPFGFGMVIIYFSANAYLIDAFPGYVASALAAKTVIRSGSGAAMPLFIEAMYHNLGNGWAASTWAFISLAMVNSRALSTHITGTDVLPYRFLSPSFFTDMALPFGRVQSVLLHRQSFFWPPYITPRVVSLYFSHHIYSFQCDISLCFHRTRVRSRLSH